LKLEESSKVDQRAVAENDNPEETPKSEKD